MAQSLNPLLPPICGPFSLGTWDASNKRFKNGHHLFVSNDKKRLEVYTTDANGANVALVCNTPINSATFTGIFVDSNNLVIQAPKATTTIMTEINGGQVLYTRLDKVPGTIITSFIGTDDLRQGVTFFANRLEAAGNAGINIRFDQNANKLIVVY